MSDPASDEPPLCPDFTPVALRRNRSDGWTAERQRGFIAALVRFGDAAKAARSVGMSAQSAYRLRRKPGAESFAAAWETALDWASDYFVADAIERALHGVTFARTYRGRFKGTIHRHDHRDLIAVLRRTHFDGLR